VSRRDLRQPDRRPFVDKRADDIRNLPPVRSCARGARARDWASACPYGVEAKVGGTFDCSFTGPEGPYVAHMRITDVEGARVVFAIRTERSG
jgi:hypothetical protein